MDNYRIQFDTIILMTDNSTFLDFSIKLINANHQNSSLIRGLLYFYISGSFKQSKYINLKTNSINLFANY